MEERISASTLQKQLGSSSLHRRRQPESHFQFLTTNPRILAEFEAKPNTSGSEKVQRSDQLKM